MSVEIAKTRWGDNELPTNRVTSLLGAAWVTQTFFNCSGKTIKYIDFVYIAYNPVGDIVETPSGGVEAAFGGVGPLESGQECTITSRDPLWVRSVIKSIVIKEIIIQYMDDTKEIISGEDCPSMEDEGSEYQKYMAAKKAAREAELAESEAREGKEKTKKILVSVLIVAGFVLGICLLGVLANCLTNCS